MASTVSSAAPDARWNRREGEQLRMRADSRFGADGMPEGWWFGRVSSVAVDTSGEVYVAHRGPAGDPIVVFDGSGRYLRSWGRDLFRVPHGLRIDPAGTIWATDIERHQVYRFGRDGELLLVLGTADTKGCDAATFAMPTDIAFGPDGMVYVSDGYGNCRVVRFSSDGTYLGEWGQRGRADGEFDTPHSVVVGPDELVYVSDRHNHRIQVFDAVGGHVRTIEGLGATQCIAFAPDGTPWIVTYRDIVELIACDSLGGRLFELDPGTFAIRRSLDVNAHWVHPTASGELWLGCLAGSVTHLYPGWIETDVDGSVDEREYLAQEEEDD
jgi:hypothetical protein